MSPDLLNNTSTTYVIANDDITIDAVQKQWFEVLPFRPSPFYSYWQKTVDSMFGLMGMAVMLLLLPILALVIYLDSPGPIFYSQMRLGFQGKLFRMYKFRSMRKDAERDGCDIWATQGDTRVTRVGRLLRATHIDELPQVFNILRGDMSLIGPRPERAAFATEMEKIEPSYYNRFAVKPGLTGLAQVIYGYGNEDQSELQKLHCDLCYIKHRSCWLDIVVIWKTVGEVVCCNGI